MIEERNGDKEFRKSTSLFIKKYNLYEEFKLGILVIWHILYSSLTSQKIDPDLKSAVERNKKYFQAYLNLETTDTALFINGLYYDLEVRLFS